MLRSLTLAAGVMSLLQAPADERGENGLPFLHSVDSSTLGTRDEACRQSRGALLHADPDPIVVVRVENPQGLEAPALGGAQELASEIYERAGVSLRWTVDETMEPDRRFTVVLASSAAVKSVLRSDAMGVTPRPRDGTPGTRAYVFLNKVESFAARHRLVVMQVLAYAMAHEIGHLLLPPNAHWPNSVMQDRWHPSLFPSGSPRLLGFTRDQAKLLRRRARRP